VRLLRADSYIAMPWKNGLGTTREVAALPDPRDSSGFQWRISIATVNGSGPFSSFPGVDRTIAVLGGEGMRLSLDGKEDALLFRGAEPFRFRGEAAVHADNLGGETTDLNVMTQRRSYSHGVKRIRCDQPLRRRARGACTALVFNGAFTIEANAQRFDVAPLDTLIEIGDGVDLHLLPANPADFFEVTLHPTPAA
jgi:environmental stress-induced protein Ves